MYTNITSKSYTRKPVVRYSCPTCFSVLTYCCLHKCCQRLWKACGGNKLPTANCYYHGRRLKTAVFSELGSLVVFAKMKRILFEMKKLIKSFAQVYFDIVFLYPHRRFDYSENLLPARFNLSSQAQNHNILSSPNL